MNSPYRHLVGHRVIVVTLDFPTTVVTSSAKDVSSSNIFTPVHLIGANELKMEWNGTYWIPMQIHVKHEGSV